MTCHLGVNQSLRPLRGHGESGLKMDADSHAAHEAIGDGGKPSIADVLICWQLGV